MLCKLVLTEPDVLILDEPTNHLDIPSREMLEEALNEYNGAVIAVSHDRYFLDSVAETLLVIGCDGEGRRNIGSVQRILEAAPDDAGVYSAYARQIQQAQRLAEQQTIAEKKKAAPAPAAKSKAPAHLKPFNKYTLEQIEQMIADHELEIEEMQNLFGSAEVYQSHTKLTQLQSDLDAKKQALQTLYEAWEYRAGA
jgi:ATP-binding cassette subfamily F protein 3